MRKFGHSFLHSLSSRDWEVQHVGDIVESHSYEFYFLSGIQSRLLKIYEDPQPLYGVYCQGNMR